MRWSPLAGVDAVVGISGCDQNERAPEHRCTRRIQLGARGHGHDQRFAETLLILEGRPRRINDKEFAWRLTAPFSGPIAILYMVERAVSDSAVS
jgi:hypothetical protein